MGIRVLIVDDSAFMRRLLTEMIEEFPGYEVAGIAKHGAEAVQKVMDLQPDIVTMDVEMPVMDGLQALAEIMKKRPTPVVMVSSLTQEGADATIRALLLGAVDFIGKPSGSISLDLVNKQEELLAKLQAAASSHRSVRRWGSETSTSVSSPKPLVNKASHVQNRPLDAAIHSICAIGTSTGGPKALETVITSLPEDLNVPVVIVQHMPAKFTASLAQRLNQISRVHVMEASHNQLLVAGCVYIAPGGKHMEVIAAGAGNYRIVLHEQDAVNGHRPSVDVMFDSVTQLKRLSKTYVIMTGMGADGAKAMQRAKKAAPNTVTIGESESTCVVYGMPRVAVELNCVDHVVPLQQISKKLLEVLISK